MNAFGQGDEVFHVSLHRGGYDLCSVYRLRIPEKVFHLQPVNLLFQRFRPLSCIFPLLQEPLCRHMYLFPVRVEGSSDSFQRFFHLLYVLHGRPARCEFNSKNPVLNPLCADELYNRHLSGPLAVRSSAGLHIHPGNLHDSQFFSGDHSPLVEGESVPFLRLVPAHESEVHGNVFADNLVCNPFDFVELLLAQLAVVGYIQSCHVGAFVSTCLPDMPAENPLCSGIDDVRGGVMPREVHSSLPVNLSVDSSRCGQNLIHQMGHNPSVFLHSDNLHLAAAALQDSGVVFLPPALGVEGRPVQYEFIVKCPDYLGVKLPHLRVRVVKKFRVGKFLRKALFLLRFMPFYVLPFVLFRHSSVKVVRNLYFSSGELPYQFGIEAV